MNDVKTIINCTAKEFLKQINTIRGDLIDFFNKTKVHEIVYSSVKIDENITDESVREKEFSRLMSERYDKILTACFGENIDVTYNAIIKMCFDNKEYVENLAPEEVIQQLMSFLVNGRTMPFFITWKNSGQLSSDT